MITGIYSESGGKRVRDGPGGDKRRYNTKGRSGNEEGSSPKLTGEDRTQGDKGEGISAPEGPNAKGKKGRKIVHAYVGYRAGIRDNGEGPRRRTGTRAHRAGTSARLVLAIGDPRSSNAAPKEVRTSTLHCRIGSARVRRTAAAQAKLRRGRPTRARGCAPRRSNGELGRQTYRPNGLDRGIEDSPIDPRPPADTL